MSNIYLDGTSYISNINISSYDGAGFANISLSEASYIEQIRFGFANASHVTFTNNILSKGSYISGITTLRIGTFSNNVLSKSYISGIVCSGYFSRIISDNILNASYFTAITMADNSNQIYNNNLTKSSIHDMNLDATDISDNFLSNSNIDNMSVSNGDIFLNTLTNGSRIRNTGTNGDLSYCTLDHSVFYFANVNGPISRINARNIPDTPYDLVASTILTNPIFSKNLFVNSANQVRLSYYDALDVLQIVNINA
jgi:hypothetical protein